ncbi:type 1 fimbrial protein [Acetobacter sp. AN02]|nr:type 1 fimbrial protein [Acetobacter sp. AN02]
MSLLSVFIALMAASVRPAFADYCSATDWPVSTATFSGTEITIPLGTQNGQKFWTSDTIYPVQGAEEEFAYGDTTAHLYCVGSGVSTGLQNMSGGSQPTSADAIFPTSVQGIGYRIYNVKKSMYEPPDGLATQPIAGANTMDLRNWPFYIELYKTGDIAAQSVLSGNIAALNFDSQPDVYFSITQAVITAVQACSVSTSDISVELPPMASDRFRSVGSTAGLQGFSIGLNCAEAVSPAVTFDSTMKDQSATGVILSTLSGAQAAQGIGIQILDSGQSPVILGEAVSAGAVPSGMSQISYYARYYQTASSVSGGKISAIASFTISYP